MCVDKICKTPKILKEDFESISRSLLTRRTGKLKVCLRGKKKQCCKIPSYRDLLFRKSNMA